MGHQKFNLAKLEKLNDPGRFETLPPDVFWAALGEPTGVIVEIGAGTGVFAAALAARSPEVTIYAADIEDTMLDWMRTNRPEVAEGRIVPVKASEANVPLPDGIASAVYMINLHHELADPDASYAEAFRLLGPGGRLLAVDWADRETPRGPAVAMRASADSLRAHVEGSGFIEVRADADRLPWHTIVTGTRPPIWTGGDPHE